MIPALCTTGPLHDRPVGMLCKAGQGVHAHRIRFVGAAPGVCHCASDALQGLHQGAVRTEVCDSHQPGLTTFILKAATSCSHEAPPRATDHLHLHQCRSTSETRAKPVPRKRLSSCRIDMQEYMQWKVHTWQMLQHASRLTTLTTCSSSSTLVQPSRQGS